MADLGRTVQAWFRKAAEDLKLAKLLETLASKDHDMLGALVFHSQQAAEKAIKGYLTKQKIRFEKTHDIGKLLNLVVVSDPKLAEELRPSEILTKYAIAYRYPEETNPPEPLTVKTGQKALKLAIWVYEEMKARV